MLHLNPRYRTQFEMVQDLHQHTQDIIKTDAIAYTFYTCARFSASVILSDFMCFKF